MSTVVVADRNGSMNGLTPKEEALLIGIRKRKSELLMEIQRIKAEIAEVAAEMDSIDGRDNGSKDDPRAKQLSTGKKKFNIDPDKNRADEAPLANIIIERQRWPAKALILERSETQYVAMGLEYLISNNLLNNTPEDIAEFLFSEEGLNKTMIGNYLGEKVARCSKIGNFISEDEDNYNSEFNLDVFRTFVELHDFQGRLLVDALREFLWSFRLPGEAQKIDRMMEGFAKRYCEQNPGVFTSPDTCYVLSFSLILLNTSLHNPSVKDKPTPERFIQMNRGINCGEDLGSEFLLSLYESIKNEQFKIPEDDGNDITRTFFNPDREGWLTKEGGLHKSWRKRYFILKDNCLYYFKNVGDREPRGIIPLENLQVRKIQDSKRKYCFEIYSADNSSSLIKACKTDSEGKVVEGHHDVYRICALSEEEREIWIGCINTSMIFDPFYDMLQARKKKVTQATLN